MLLIKIERLQFRYVKHFQSISNNLKMISSGKKGKIGGN